MVQRYGNSCTEYYENTEMECSLPSTRGGEVVKEDTFVSSLWPDQIFPDDKKRVHFRQKRSLCRDRRPERPEGKNKDLHVIG